MPEQLNAGLDSWTLVIRPRGRWFDLRLREVWQARDLIGLFVWRDFVTVYKQTLLGPLWFVVQPLLTTLMLTLVFGKIANLPSDGVPHFAFYLAGTVVFTYFANCFTRTANTFVQNQGLFGKVYFPRLSVPLSIVISNVVTFAIQLALLLVLIGAMTLRGASFGPRPSLVLAPLLLVLMAGLGMGVGLLVSAVTVRYRDLQQLVSVGVQLLMFATPVIYPLSAVGPKYRWLIAVNPLTPIVEGFRLIVLGVGTVDAAHVMYSAACAGVALLAGVMAFNRVERTFMDSI